DHLMTSGKIFQVLYFNFIKNIDGIKKAIRSSVLTTGKTCRINVSFGLILEHKTSEVKYSIFYPGANTSWKSTHGRISEDFPTISNMRDLDHYVNEFSYEEIKQFLTRFAPDSESIPIGVFSISIDRMISNVAFGAPCDIPLSVKQSKSIRC